jgi:hypothetical protein
MTLLTVVSPGFVPSSYWWLANPSSGSNSVSITGAGIFFNVVTNCASYSGASQTAPTNFITSTAPVNPLTMTINVYQTNDWLSAFVRNGTGDATLAGGMGTVVRSDNSGIGLSDSNGPVNPGVDSLTFSSDGAMIGILVDINPAGGAGATTTTTASNATALYSTSSLPVTLNATITAAGTTINTGTVTFTVLSGGVPLGSPVTSGTVTNGNASATYTLPAGTLVNSYTILAAYSGATGLANSSDLTHAVTVSASGLTFDASSTNFTANSNSFSFNHTVGTAANRILVCGVFSNSTNGNGLSGISYAGSAMTLITVDSPGFRPTTVWWLANPPSGTNSVTVSGTGSFFNVYTLCASYSGASQAVPINFANQSGSSTTTPFTLTTGANNDWLLVAYSNPEGAAPTAGAGTVIRVPDGFVGLADSGAPITPAGSASVNIVGAGGAGGIVIDIRPAGS